MYLAGRAPFPNEYEFMPLDQVERGEAPDLSGRVLLAVDCANEKRLGPASPAMLDAAELVVNIDHHHDNSRFGDVNLIVADASSTGEVLRDVFERLGVELTPEIAEPLYIALVTDTGRFQYDNTTPEVFELARELSSYDLPIAELTRQLFEEHSFRYLKMVGACLARAELDRDLRFVATWVTNFDLEGFDVDVSETEGLIDLVRRTAEADVACVCKETPEGVRVSLRSTAEEIDVGAIAMRFGGGGHRYAAGFVAPYPVTGVLSEIREAEREQRESLGRS